MINNEIFCYLGKGVFYALLTVYVLGVVANGFITSKPLSSEENCRAVTRAINAHTLRDNDDNIITWDSIVGKQIKRQCNIPDELTN